MDVDGEALQRLWRDIWFRPRAGVESDAEEAERPWHLVGWLRGEPVYWVDEAGRPIVRRPD